MSRTEYNDNALQFQSQIVINDTTNASISSASLMVSGGLSTQDTYVTGHVAVNNVKITPNLNDIIFEQQAILDQSKSEWTNIPDFSFNNSVSNSFKAFVNITVAAGISKYAIWEINGIYKPSGWSITSSFTGDLTNINFRCLNTNGVGQIQYINSNGEGSTTTIRYRATTTAPIGTTPTGSVGIINNTNGPYIANTLLYSNTVNTLASTDLVYNSNVFKIGPGSRIVAENANSFTNFSNGGSITAMGDASVAQELIVGAKVGIANTNPSFALDVSGDINFTGNFYKNNSLYSGSSIWQTNETDVFYTAGNVGLGTTSPAYTLDINGTLRTTNMRLNDDSAINIDTGSESRLALVKKYGEPPSISTNATSNMLFQKSNSNSAGNPSVNTYTTLMTLTPAGNLTVTGTTNTVALSTGNLYVTNISTGTLNATRGSFGTVSSTLVSATTMTGGSISLSGNLNVAGTLTVVNITSTNMVETNITTATLLATTSVSSGILNATNTTVTNAVHTALSTGTFNLTSAIASTGITTATLLATTSISSGSIQGTNSTITNAVHTALSTGSLNITNVLSTSSMIVRTFNRTLNTTVNNSTEICSLNATHGSYIVYLNIVHSETGSSESKTYIVPIQFNSTAGNWKRLAPFSSGPYSENDWAVDMTTFQSVSTFRLVRVSGTGSTVGFTCTFTIYQSATSPVTVSDISATASNVINTGIYESTQISQVNNLVGINTDAPLFTLDVNGSIRASTGITTATLLATTSISSGSIQGTNSTITNAVHTSLSSGNAQFTNLNATSSTIGTFIASSGTVGGHLVPSTDITYDLGSSSLKWRDLYLSGNTIYLGDKTLSVENDTFNIANVSATNANLITSSIGTLINTNTVNTNISSGTLNLSTGITTATLLATTSISSASIQGTNTTVTNAVHTALSTGTLIASTGITTATLLATTSVSSASIQGTNTTVTNAVHTALSTGTLNLTSAIASTGITTATLLATTSVSSASIQGTNTTVTNAVHTTLSSGNAIFTTSLTTATLLATTSISSGILNATNTTVTNAVHTNISTSTLFSTTGSFGTVSSSLLSATTMTGGSISLSGNLNVAGTLTVVNITSTNMVETNITTATLLATTSVSSGILNATNTTVTNAVHTTLTSASLLVTGIATVNTLVGNVTSQTANDTLYVGTTGNTNFFLDRPSANNGGSIIFGFNTQKTVVSRDIIQIINNSTDRNTLLQVQSKGTSSGTDQVTIPVSLIASFNNNTLGSIITTGGNVGVGTAAPGYRLDVNGTIRGNSDIIISGASRLSFFNDIGPLQIRSGGSGMLHLNQDNAGNISLGAGGGNVGVGTVTPGYKLHVSGDIYASGDITAFSDIRLKENIVQLSGCLDKIDNMRGVSFNRIDTGTKHIGLIAQEVEAQFPELVATDPNSGFKSVNYGNVVAVLLECIRELKGEVNELKSRII